MQESISSTPTYSTTRMIKATDPRCTGAKAPSSSTYLRPWSPHLPQWLRQNSPLSLPPIQHLPYTLSLKGDWALLQEIRAIKWNFRNSTSMCIYSNFILLYPLPIRFLPHLSFWVQSYLRPFAPAALSGWNSPLISTGWLLCGIQIFA